MENAEEYTAYRRISLLSIIVYWILLVAFVMWLGDLMDTYPDLDEFLTIFLVVVLICGPFLVGQLVSRVRSIVAIRPNGAIVIDGKRTYPAFREPYSVVMLREISEVTVGYGLLTGNYIAMELHTGDAVKLYAKRHMFGHNPEFFDLYLVLRNAWYEEVAAEREKAIPEELLENPKTVSTYASAEESNPSLPTSTPIPKVSNKVRSAVRNPNEHEWQYETHREKSKPRNGILVAAIVFCVFLLVMASTISSFHVPDELVAIREAIYTMLVLIGLVLGGIAVATFVKSRNDHKK